MSALGSWRLKLAAQDRPTEPPQGTADRSAQMQEAGDALACGTASTPSQRQPLTTPLVPNPWAMEVGSPTNSVIFLALCMHDFVAFLSKALKSRSKSPNAIKIIELNYRSAWVLTSGIQPFKKFELNLEKNAAILI